MIIDKQDHKFDETQQAAFDVMLHDDMALITGQAGTGKSYLAQKFLETVKASGKTCKIFAPTGRAAVNVNGITADRLFGFSRSPYKLWEGYNVNKIIRALHDTDIIIGDEVSMIGYHMFDMIMRRLVNCRWNGSIILMGDFRQLPPVKDDWIFDHPIFSDFSRIELQHNHRQASDEVIFRDILYKVGRGIVDDDVITFIKERMISINDIPEHDIYLTPTNHDAIHYNRQKIKELNVSKRLFHGRAIPANLNKVDDTMLRKGWQAVQMLPRVTLCVGCRVVLTHNDAEGLFVNGDLGTVVDFLNNEPIVRIDRTDITVVISKIRKDIKDASETTLCTYEALPLKLGWACTIHKSQGMNLPNATINCSPMSNQRMTHGLAYVAMSRVTSSNNIRFSKFNPNAIYADHDILHYV